MTVTIQDLSVIDQRRLSLLSLAAACLLVDFSIIGCNRPPPNGRQNGFTVSLTRDPDSPYPGITTSNVGHLDIASRTTIEEIDGKNYFTSMELPNPRVIDPKRPPYYVKTAVRYTNADRQVMEISLKCTIITRLEFPSEALGTVDVRSADTNEPVSAPWELGPGEYKLLTKFSSTEQRQAK